MQYRQERIAQRIKQEREALDLTKAGLAEHLNVNRNTITTWERQDEKGRIPPLDDLLHMCELFQCEHGYLLCEYDCKTRVATNIHTETGLSEGAIQILVRYLQDSVIFSTALSQMIEHPAFYYLVMDLAQWNHRLQQKELVNLDEVSEYTRNVPRGLAVLFHDDAAEFWLQKARDSLRDIAKDIWVSGKGGADDGK